VGSGRRALSHLRYFDSAKDLAAKLLTADLPAISASMRKHTAELRPVMASKWRSVLRKLFEGQPTGSWPSAPRGGDAGGFDEALASRFDGLALPAAEPDCSRRSAPELGRWA
jgi:hypothetical protein